MIFVALFLLLLFTLFIVLFCPCCSGCEGAGMSSSVLLHSGSSVSVSSDWFWWGWDDGVGSLGSNSVVRWFRKEVGRSQFSMVWGASVWGVYSAARGFSTCGGCSSSFLVNQAVGCISFGSRRWDGLGVGSSSMREFVSQFTFSYCFPCGVAVRSR